MRREIIRTMIFQTVLAIILTGVQAASLDSNVSINIVKGDVAAAHAYPFVVLIKLPGGIHCNGILISSKFVLTDGICIKIFDSVSIKNTTVELGAHDLTEYEETRITARVKNVVVHPKYRFDGNHGIVENNIALIELGNTIGFSDTIQPAKLSRSDSTYVGQMGRTCGWGGDRKNSVLLTFANKVIPLSTCRKQEIGAEVNSICISADLGQRLRDWDDGAPLIINGVVVGVASQPRSDVSIFTRINAFLDWIEANSDVRKKKEICLPYHDLKKLQRVHE